MSPISPARDHFARLAHHRVAGVVQGHGEDELLRPRQGDELLGFRHRHRQGLVANDVDPGLEEGLGDRVVEVVRRDDDDGFDAVRPCRLASRHLAIIGEDAVRREPEIGAREAGILRVGRKRAGRKS